MCTVVVLHSYIMHSVLLDMLKADDIYRHDIHLCCCPFCTQQENSSERLVLKFWRQEEMRLLGKVEQADTALLGSSLPKLFNYLF